MLGLLKTSGDIMLVLICSGSKGCCRQVKNKNIALKKRFIKSKDKALSSHSQSLAILQNKGLDIFNENYYLENIA